MYTLAKTQRLLANTQNTPGQTAQLKDIMENKMTKTRKFISSMKMYQVLTHRAYQTENKIFF